MAIFVPPHLYRRCRPIWDGLIEVCMAGSDYFLTFGDFPQYLLSQLKSDPVFRISFQQCL